MTLCFEVGTKEECQHLEWTKKKGAHWGQVCQPGPIDFIGHQVAAVLRERETDVGAGAGG